jgi:type I restriction enzyme S subunit
MTWGAFMTIIRSEINPYILAFLRTPAFRAQLTSAKTTTVNQITIGMLSKIPLPLPPLSLQQSFAAKVSAIEAQKQAITQSIQHTEALLAQRMDNYFS